jgi:hypothetical protein
MHKEEFSAGCRCAGRRPKDSSAEFRLVRSLDCGHGHSSYGLQSIDIVCCHLEVDDSAESGEEIEADQYDDIDDIN